PYLYRRLGKWRLYNQYNVIGGTYVLPLISSPGSTNSGLTTTTFTAFSGGQFALQAMSDTTGLAPYSGANELFEFSVSFTVLLTPSLIGAGNYYANVGACIASGTSVSLLGSPLQTIGYDAPIAASPPNMIFPIT